MARRPLSAVSDPRLEASAEGRDIVGLKPGESFDPLADLDAFVAEKTKHARHVVRVPRGFTLDQLVDAVVEVAPDWGFDRAGTRGFLDGAASTQRLPNQKLAAAIEAAGRLGYRLEVQP